MQTRTNIKASNGHHGHSHHQHGHADSTTEFRRYMLNRNRRNRRVERGLFWLLVCFALLLGLFIVCVFVLGL